jgi:uncharacterized repeat protein (TIGR01451 family)
MAYANILCLDDLNPVQIEGCTDPTSCNFDPAADVDDDSCTYPVEFYDCNGICLSDQDLDGVCDELEIPGCTDPWACNFLPEATDDDGSCIYADEFYDCDGMCLSDQDLDGVCDELEIPGCTDPSACNFLPEATDNDGSCGLAGCTDPEALNFDSLALCDDGTCEYEGCSAPSVSIYAPSLIRCFSEQLIYVSACNLDTAGTSIVNPYVELTLDTYIILDSATTTYTSLGDNRYQFDTDDLNPGECFEFTLYSTIDCDAELNETLCMGAELLPVDSCVMDTISGPEPGTVAPCTEPWDKSSLSVEGWCDNDTVYFEVTNGGEPEEGDMVCYSEVRVFIDEILYLVDSVMLAGETSEIFSFAGTGQTFILQADQHPLHPGNSNPNDHVELCGSGADWNPDLINNYPLDDADPWVDIYCGVVSGSFDPNDKMGYPLGVTDNHFIQPNENLQYVIRFQNTGTDTAHTVVIRDTLDMNLNFYSLVNGVASHPHEFSISSEGVVEWEFSNIMLPDSNVNELASHGFVTFQVKQKPDLPDGTTITNKAGIYFDFNQAIITNLSHHTVQSGYCPYIPLFQDNDDDGFGNSDFSISSCSESTQGYVPLGGDCDDTNPNINPQALGSGEFIDNNCNGILDPDEGSLCAGDFNFDGTRDTLDLLELLSHMGCSGFCPGDLDSSGEVNTTDILAFLSIFGTNCP